jgi:hypothetical protein
MPIIPLAGDDERLLDDVVRATADHGGRWVLGSGLTLDGAQRDLTIDAARVLDPGLPDRWRALYAARHDSYDLQIARLVRSLCERRGLADRMPRPVLPGARASNKRVAERLFLRTYDLELAGAQPPKIWAYRKAAWAVDAWPEALATTFRRGGLAALRGLPAVGDRIATEIAAWLAAEPAPEPADHPAPRGQLTLAGLE